MEQETFILFQARLIKIYVFICCWKSKENAEMEFVEKYSKNLRIFYDCYLKGER